MTTRLLLALASLALFSACAQTAATRPLEIDMQAHMTEMMQLAMPGEAHAELAEMAGTWDTVMSYRQGPDAPWMDSDGTTTYEVVLGGRYVVGTSTGTWEFDGQAMPWEAIQWQGFDNLTGEFTSIWYGDHSTWGGATRGRKNAAGEVVYEGLIHDAATPQGRPTRGVAVNEGPDKMVFKMWDSIAGEMVHTMTWTATRS
jgi:HAMP domain-containing protein